MHVASGGPGPRVRSRGGLRNLSSGTGSSSEVTEGALTQCGAIIPLEHLTERQKRKLVLQWYGPGITYTMGSDWQTLTSTNCRGDGRHPRAGWLAPVVVEVEVEVEAPRQATQHPSGPRCLVGASLATQGTACMRDGLPLCLFEGPLAKVVSTRVGMLHRPRWLLGVGLGLQIQLEPFERPDFCIRRSCHDLTTGMAARVRTMTLWGMVGA